MPIELQISKTLSPEDVNVRDFVTVTHMTYEVILYDCDQTWKERIDTKPVTILHGEAGKALKVVEVCLPFVLVKDAKGEHTTLDLRRCRLARLSDSYGKKMFKAVKGE